MARNGICDPIDKVITPTQVAIMSYIVLSTALPPKEYEFNSYLFPSSPFTCPGCSKGLVFGTQVWNDFVDSILHNSDKRRLILCEQCAQTPAGWIKENIEKLVAQMTQPAPVFNWNVVHENPPVQVDKPNTVVMVSARQCEVCFGKGRDTKEFKICKHCYGRGKIWEEKEQNGIT